MQFSGSERNARRCHGRGLAFSHPRIVKVGDGGSATHFPGIGGQQSATPPPPPSPLSPPAHRTGASPTLWEAQGVESPKPLEGNPPGMNHPLLQQKPCTKRKQHYCDTFWCTKTRTQRPDAAREGKNG